MPMLFHYNSDTKEWSHTPKLYFPGIDKLVKPCSPPMHHFPLGHNKCGCQACDMNSDEMLDVIDIGKVE